jgi:3-deoxy-D-manno-octulosonic-acid transferase
MPRLFYSVFFYLLLPLVLLRLCYRALKAPDYRRRVGERFGFFAKPGQHGGLWVHAVSVGEVIAAAPLVEHFLKVEPALPVVVTTMTPTGSERVHSLFGDRVFHVYAPYDLPDAVARFLNRIRPAAAVIMETEIWPNMVCQTAARGVPVILANARLSARSAKGYQRLPRLTRQVFSRFSSVMAQAEPDAGRFAALGVSIQALQVTGSVKFDVEIPEARRDAAASLRASWGRRPVWIAASTHAGEDEILLAAHRLALRKAADLLLIIVPRHPERFQYVAGLVSESGLGLSRRSLGELVVGATQVLLVDTMGELMTFFGTADLAFVGGSLVARGGHNCLEPAAWGLPILTGNSDFNFAEASALLEEAGAKLCIDDAASLAAEIGRLLEEPERRQRMGSAAKGVVEANRGALRRQIGIIESTLRR